MEWAKAYLFAYLPEVGVENDHGPQDMIPLVIITRRISGRGFMGINLVGIPSLYRKRKLIEAFAEASAIPKTSERIRAMLRLELLVRNSEETKGAFKFYRRSRIKGRIIEAGPTDLEELLEKRILTDD